MSETNHEMDMDYNDHVSGERQIPSVTRGQSLQSKMNNVFAVALMLLLGGGFLTWYYTNLYAKKDAEEEKRKQQQEQLMQSTGSLPKLGAVPFPQPKTPLPPEPVETVDAGNLFGPAPGSAATINNGPKEPTPEEVAQMRRLTTPVYVKPDHSALGMGQTTSVDPNQHTTSLDALAGLGYRFGEIVAANNHSYGTGANVTVVNLRDTERPEGRLHVGNRYRLPITRHGDLCVGTRHFRSGRQGATIKKRYRDYR